MCRCIIGIEVLLNLFEKKLGVLLVRLIMLEYCFILIELVMKLFVL